MGTDQMYGKYNGLIDFEPVTDPGKILAAKQQFDEWSAHVENIKAVAETFGWDSNEMTAAQLKYKTWQQACNGDRWERVI